MSSVVISSQVRPESAMASSVSSTGASSAQADPAVEVVVERLEVHVGGVHRPEELRAGSRLDVARRDRDRPQAPLATGRRDIDGVLEEDDRVVVGEGDAATAPRSGARRDVLGRGRVGEGVPVARRGDVPVLAEATAQVAAGRAEAQGRGAGQEVDRAASSRWGRCRSRWSGRRWSGRPRHPARARTKQNPRWPSRSRHARGQTSHWTRPSGRRCQNRVGWARSGRRIEPRLRSHPGPMLRLRAAAVQSLRTGRCVTA